MKSNKKLTIALILAFSLVLFSTSAYARSFTDVLGDSFILINDFFKNEGYKPYSLIIDFFVFSIVFIAIYMRGVKFAFKEVTKTEKALAVILGLTTAFLMVIGGYSISKLLPFVNWFLYFLLFVLIWWLLKDMKSKWARFFLALLLTLLLILIFLALFSGISANISCPEKALPWLPWVLALLLFILFLFLLKDIKNAFGRVLLALLLTITVVLLILFLLNTFSKDIGCPETPFGTTLIGDIGDSFKRMEIGSIFTGFGAGPSLPTLPQVKPPDKEKDEAGLTLAPQVQRPFKQIDNQELDRLRKDPKTAPDIKQKIEEEIRIRNEQEQQRIRQESEKSADVLGKLMFSDKERETIPKQNLEKSVIDRGKQLGYFSITPGGKKEYYIEEGKDGKPVLKKQETFLWIDRLWSDSTVDPLQHPDLKKLQPQSSVPSTGTQAADASTRKSTFVDFNSTTSIWIFLIASAILFWFWRPLGNLANKLRRRKEKKPTIEEILNKIDEISENKRNWIENLKTNQKRKEPLIKAHEVREAYLKRLAEEGERKKITGLRIGFKRKGEEFWWEEEETLEEEEKGIDALSKIEKQWIKETRELIKLEVEFVKSLRIWVGILREAGINIEDIYSRLESLIVTDSNSILKLLLQLYNIEVKEEHLEEELERYLEKEYRTELISKKHKRFLEDESQLDRYNNEEAINIHMIDKAIERQNILLSDLKGQIERERAGATIQTRGGEENIVGTRMLPEFQLETALQNLNILLSDVQLAKSKVKVESIKQLIVSYEERLNEMQEELKAALRIVKNPSEIHVSLIVFYMTENSSRGRENFAELWALLLHRNITTPEFIDRLVALISEDVKPIEEYLSRIIQSRRKFVKKVAIAGGILVGGGLAASAGLDYLRRSTEEEIRKRYLQIEAIIVPITATRSNIGVPAGSEVTVHLKIIGGEPPFQIKIGFWKHISEKDFQFIKSDRLKSDNNEYTTKHILKEEGNFMFVFEVTDKNKKTGRIDVWVFVRKQ